MTNKLNIEFISQMSESYCECCGPDFWTDIVINGTNQEDFSNYTDGTNCTSWDFYIIFNAISEKIFSENSDLEDDSEILLSATTFKENNKYGKEGNVLFADLGRYKTDKHTCNAITNAYFYYRYKNLDNPEKFKVKSKNSEGYFDTFIGVQVDDNPPIIWEEGTSWKDNTENINQMLNEMELDYQVTITG